jgi:glycosyltransferase involved in cell wall biosynthesis
LFKLDFALYNWGVSANRNFGAGLSNDDYLIFLDGDDQLLPNKIETDLPMVKDCDPQENIIVWSNFLFGVSLDAAEA